MRITGSEIELRRQLEAAGLDPARLDPWRAWTVFKEFLATRADVADGGASVQITREETPDGFLAYVQLIRQFTAIEDGVDVPVRYVTLELAYRPLDLQFEDDVDVWSYDFPSQPDFFAHVEGMALFQRAMSGQPVSTDVVSDEI